MAEVRYDVQKALCVCVLAVTNVFYKLTAIAETTLKRLCHEKKLKYLVKIDPKCNILVNIWYSLCAMPFLFFRKKRENRKVEEEKMNVKKRKAKIRNSLCQIHCL
jgi:hypothetical protein